MWLCRLEFIYGSCMMVILHIFLKKLFLEQWVGRGGPTCWPARFPNLNSSDIYLLGHPGLTVHSTEVRDVQNTERI